MDRHVIDIAKDFSRYPGGRKPEDGPYSGLEFLEKHLKPAVMQAQKDHSTVVVKIDGVAGLPSSFLEEAFGGLIRSRVLNLADAARMIVIEALTSRVRIYPEMIRRYMNDAAAKLH